MSSKTLKIFEINGCDWWADFSLEEAITNYFAFTGAPASELDDDPPRELTPVEMNTLMYCPDPYEEPGIEKRTFKEELERHIKENGNMPFFFASTEY